MMMMTVMQLYCLIYHFPLLRVYIINVSTEIKAKMIQVIASCAQNYDYDCMKTVHFAEVMILF